MNYKLHKYPKMRKMKNLKMKLYKIIKRKLGWTSLIQKSTQFIII
jgi:hypothetical protein